MAPGFRFRSLHPRTKHPKEKPEDEALWLNAGKFLARGYVLKPAFMMGAEAGIVSYATQMASQTLGTEYS